MTNEIITTGILALFETTKEQRKNFVDEIIDKIKEGEIDPIKVHSQVKSLEDIGKQITSNKEYIRHLVDYAEKYGTKSFSAFNAKFEVREVGVKYDYSQTGDVVLFDLQKKLDELTDSVKERQKFLQTVPENGIILTIESTGETFTVYPPSKSSTTNLVTTLL